MFLALLSFSSSKTILPLGIRSKKKVSNLPWGASLYAVAKGREYMCICCYMTTKLVGTFVRYDVCCSCPIGVGVGCRRRTGR